MLADTPAPLSTATVAPSAMNFLAVSGVSATRVSPGAADPPPKPKIQLADEVVLRALDERQASFMRCFERAQKLDGIGRTEVILHLEIDALGIVHAASNDAIDDRLRVCVTAVALHLVFSEPGQPVVLDVPILFH